MAGIPCSTLPAPRMTNVGTVKHVNPGVRGTRNRPIIAVLRASLRRVLLSPAFLSKGGRLALRNFYSYQLIQLYAYLDAGEDASLVEVFLRFP